MIWTATWLWRTCVYMRHLSHSHSSAFCRAVAVREDHVFAKIPLWSESSSQQHLLSQYPTLSPHWWGVSGCSHPHFPSRNSCEMGQHKMCGPTDSPGKCSQKFKPPSRLCCTECGRTFTVLLWGTALLNTKNFLFATGCRELTSAEHVQHEPSEGGTPSCTVSRRAIRSSLKPSHPRLSCYPDGGGHPFPHCPS